MTTTAGTSAVSVAMCTHNGALFVEEQVTSILSQSRAPDELVVSDDASTDNTLAIVRAAWQRARDAGCHTRLIILERDVPLGVTANFDLAVRATGGEIVFLSDQDDVWSLSKIERQIDQLESDPSVLLVFSDARLTDGAGNNLGSTLFNALQIRQADLASMASPNAFHTLLRRNIVTGATVAFRRELLGFALPFDAEWLHDEWLAIIAAGTGGLRPLPETLIEYRQHGGNQVGVSAPGLRHKIARVLEPRGQRTAGLQRRTAALIERLVQIGDPLNLIEHTREKESFEANRAQLPTSRIARIAPVAAMARRSLYSRYASRGRMDILRDLLQAAGPTS